jgi:hypothetical protein
MLVRDYATLGEIRRHQASRLLGKVQKLGAHERNWAKLGEIRRH